MHASIRTQLTRPRDLLLPALLLLGGLLGCTKPDVQEGQVNSFEIVSAKGRTHLEKPDSRATWYAPDQVSISFEACVKSRTTGKDIINPEFTVINVETQEAIAEVKPILGSNCLGWQETLSFNFFSQKSAWVSIPRKIVGSNLYSGSHEIPFAINPWAVGGTRRDGVDPVVDLRSINLPKDQLIPAPRAKAFLQGVAMAAQLHVDEVHIKTIRESDSTNRTSGSALLLEVEMSPQIRFQDSEGRSRYEKIDRGEVDLSMQVMATQAGPHGKDSMLLLMGSPSSATTVRNGKAKFEVKVLQTQRVNQGNLELVLKLSPKGICSIDDSAPLTSHSVCKKSLREFHGVFRLGTDTQIKSGSATLANECYTEEDALGGRPANPCNYSKRIKSASNLDQLRKLGYVHSNDPYIFSNLKLRFTRVLPGETATQRTVAYSASTCITDRFTGDRLADTPFVVKYLSASSGAAEGSTQIRTDESGCLNWSSDVFHKYYQPEDFIKKVVSIEKSSGFKRQLAFYLNPWDDKFTFGWDEREFTKEFFEEIKNRKKIKSRFFLSGFKYHTLRFLYEIDPFMELEVKKTILLEIHPMALRYSGIISARKNIENLRDGIYLMKVALQKNYLDPADRGGFLLSSQKDNKNRLTTKVEKIGGFDVPAREFVNTRSYIVRVVDGMIVQPVELSVRDLRLMRIRANFLVQLETVDERLIQANPILKQFAYAGDLGLRKKLKELEALEGQEASTSSVRNQEGRHQDDIRARKAKVISAIRDIEQQRRKALQMLKSKLQSGSPSDPGENFDLEPQIAEPLKKALAINDFTEVKFPQGENGTLQDFAESDSGLEPRSFVGPVIFLSNAFSDSMRATDNLDEAKCPVANNDTLRPDQFTDQEWEKISELEGQAQGKVQNKSYEYNPYFGSLRHLCNRSVDQLISVEKGLKENTQEVLETTATKYNFAEFGNLDYLSLKEEKLKKLAPDCQGPISNCLIETNERSISKNTALRWVNSLWSHQRFYNNWLRFKTWYEWIRGRGDHKAEPSKWTESDLGKLFFEDSASSKAGLCALLAARASEKVKEFRGSAYAQPTALDRTGNVSYLAEKCLSDDGLARETRLHVHRTGQYTYKGGQQLNVNVGESFSVSLSSSRSMSFDWMDVIGLIGSKGKTGSAGGLSQAAGTTPGMLGRARGAVDKAMKPFGLSMSTSLSGSDGTSISHSTYLVSQIAGFMINLEEYEQCSVIRFKPDFLKSLMEGWSELAKLPMSIAVPVLGSGLMVCDGEIRREGRQVEETYFYFTQHFTEGDMLDQADLYNHPWLLSMRGVRDFEAFVKRINAQQVVGFENLAKGALGWSVRPLNWALGHMNQTYKHMMPTFPGFYTVLPKDERAGIFPLDMKLEEQAF